MKIFSNEWSHLRTSATRRPGGGSGCLRLVRVAPALALLVLLSLVARTHAAPPPAQPLPRDGGCPTGYYASASYCVPGSSARFALPKAGSCPSGYYASGNYCIAASASARMVIPKVGACPSGYYSSGNYCVSVRD